MIEQILFTFGCKLCSNAWLAVYVILKFHTGNQVYPHVATGFSDTSAFLRELTLKSMLVLAPKVFS